MNNYDELHNQKMFKTEYSLVRVKIQVTNFSTEIIGTMNIEKAIVDIESKKKIQQRIRNSERVELK